MSDRNQLQVAVHEAAHLLYAARFGATEVVFHAAQTRNGMKYHALVECNIPKGTPFWDGARFLAAGGVAEKVLMTNAKTGDGSDQEQFFEEVVADKRLSLEQGMVVWKAAQQEVEKDLRNPGVHQLLQTLAEQVRANLQQAEESPSREVFSLISEFKEVALILQLLDRHSEPL